MINESLPESVLDRFPQYSHNIGFYVFTPYQIILDLVLAESLKPNSMIMDAGCGLKSAIPLNTPGVAVDILHENVKMLKQQRRDVGCVCASLEALPFRQECFSIVYSRDVLEHCDSKAVIEEISRVLNRGGEFIASTSNLISPIMLVDQYFSSITNRIAEKAGSKYYRRDKHLDPYGFKFQLSQAGMLTEQLFMITTPPLLTARTWREFKLRFPLKLVPWLILSMALEPFRIFREILVVKAKKW
jgi:SAM-dependent methyltransferase